MAWSRDLFASSVTLWVRLCVFADYLRNSVLRKCTGGMLQILDRNRVARTSHHSLVNDPGVPGRYQGAHRIRAMSELKHALQSDVKYICLVLYSLSIFPLADDGSKNMKLIFYRVMEWVQRLQPLAAIFVFINLKSD